MNKIISKDVYSKTWPLIKQKVEQQGCSLVIAKRLVCKLAGIPGAQDNGFQRIKDFVDWREQYLKIKRQERRWIKC